MTHIPTEGTGPVQSLPVFDAKDFIVTNGANLGDPLSFAADVMLDDIYTLSENARRLRLALSAVAGSDIFTIHKATEIGTPGSTLHLDCCATLMPSDGSTVEVIVMVEVSALDDAVEGVYFLPMANLNPKQEYSLVGIDKTAARARVAEVACVSFTRGTNITLADGRQCPIEILRAGDKILTRDNGTQEIRWVGQNTVRATGSFAPILIAKGTLHNENDLTVSPNHRLFIYQRHDSLKLGRSEVLVKAKYLVNGTTVRQLDGGFVDYFQLLFDQHEIIYAEGIAAESLQLDTRTRSALPEDVVNRLASAGTAMQPNRGAEFEVSEQGLGGLDIAEVLRRASSG